MKINTNIETTSIDLIGILNNDSINVINSEISGLVLKEIGKQLSENDFTDALKSKLDGIESGAEVNISSNWTATEGKAQILNKPDLTVFVEKIEGYDLSENDFTDTLKSKLDGIEELAQVNVNADWNATIGDAVILNKPVIVNSDLFVGKITGYDLSKNDFTDTLKSKLDGIEPGAEVNINPNWTAITGKAVILNKPILLTINDVKNDSTISNVISNSHLAETTTSIGTLINNASAKTTPTDSDNIGISDSANSGYLKKISWANIKSALKTYFDSIYTASNLNAVPNTITINSKQLNTNIVLSKSDIGLSNIDNTSDLNKPLSLSVQTALAGKEPTIIGVTQNFVLNSATLHFSNGILTSVT